MSPVERLQAAIEKLEKLRDESTPASWHYWTDELTGEVDIWHDGEARSHVAQIGKHEDVRVYRDADLIVTLHRTIDAQLAILRNTVRLHGEFVALGKESHWLEAIERAGDLALADAILGSDQ